MKYYLLLITILISGCSTTKQVLIPFEYNVSLTDEINSSIIDGFNNGDTINIPKNIYLLR
jgi:hypothetical protein